MFTSRTSRFSASVFAVVMTVVVHAAVLLPLDHMAQNAANELASAQPQPTASLATVTTVARKI